MTRAHSVRMNNLKHVSQRDRRPASNLFRPVSGIPKFLVRNITARVRTQSTNSSSLQETDENNTAIDK